jgi:hypothetical protein
MARVPHGVVYGLSFLLFQDWKCEVFDGILMDDFHKLFDNVWGAMCLF